MTRINYENGVHKDMGKAQAHVVNLGDKTSMKIVLQPGFDWVSEVGPKLPGCPKWCPANHFGYLESGTMKVKYEDGSDVTVNAGESYLIPPGATRPLRFRRRIPRDRSLPRVFRRIAADDGDRPLPSTIPRPPSRGHRRHPLRHGRVLPVHRRRRLQHEGLMTPRGTSERHPRTRTKRQKRRRSTAHPLADNMRRRRRCSFSDNVEVLTRYA